ncbi:PaaI family thioesterase [Gordonia humi]|uniref:Thioesterase domain-containing protein n=1 Tax=Gordonia humi TaxID=686429 RepID=A0A840FD60_9ACTN|nr:PaaI family thioesterase [Gordonia humi]MBB4137417.1 hypothetical protein [Gordonia humi]
MSVEYSAHTADESVAVAEVSWIDDLPLSEPADDAFADLTAAVRELQEAFTRSRPDADTAVDVADRLRAAAALLRDQEVSEDEQLAGRLWSRAGRGQTMAPDLVFDEVGEDHARGHVIIERFHSGRYALNGGVTPMIFDEILSRLGNAHGRRWARTASMTVDYRAPAPLFTPLTVTAELIDQVGRKRRLRGAITHGDRLIAEAHGLWIETRPEHDTRTPTDRGDSR